jgi:hypothetical protein
MEYVGKCIHCGCSVYWDDDEGKAVWTGPSGCLCELDECLDTKEEGHD